MLVTGFWLGEGGIASPSRGVRVPELLRLPPGIGGRRRGTGEDIGWGSTASPSWLLSGYLLISSEGISSTGTSGLLSSGC